MPKQLSWSTLLKRHRQTNARQKGRHDLHDVLRISPEDAGMLPFKEELEYVNPKKNRSEDLFILGCNTGEKTTIQVYLKRRPLPQIGRYDPLRDSVEVNFNLVDDQGNSYSMKETAIVPFNNHEYRAAGFAYEALQGNKIGRIKFRGYLQRNDEPKLVYVQIRFLCLYYSKVFDHQRFYDDTFLLKQLKATSAEVVGPFGEHILEDKLEQLCQIKGTLKVEDGEERELFFLATVGRRFLPKKEQPPRNVTKICGFDVQGSAFQLGLVAIQPGISYFYGFATRRDENFKACLKLINLDADKWASIVKQESEELIEFEMLVEEKRSYKIEILPYKGRTRLVKVNGVDGMCFVDEQQYEDGDTIRKFEWTDEDEVNFDEALVVELDENCAQATELTGGKGSSLARLRQLSLKKNPEEWTVARGVIVTTTAYQFQTKAMGMMFEEKLKELETSVINRSNVEVKCGDFVQWFTSVQLCKQIKKQLVAELDDTFGNVNWPFFVFAVRSSAANEDSSEMSSAGQMTTYLGVTGLEQICRAVIGCWASQFAYVPVEYKRGYGQPINCPMAVVVQKMVNCTSAGVIFTANPTDGDERRLMVTSNFGLGESVVSAAAEPDTFTLAVDIEANSYQSNRKVKEIVSKVLGKKAIVTKLKEKGDGEVEISHEQADGDVMQKQSLEDADLLRLGNIALEIATHYGSPCDIEWGILASTGQLFIFQSRPITNLDSHFTDYELMHELDTAHQSEDEIFTRAHIGEIMPGAVSWMDSFYTGSQFLMVRDLVKEGVASPTDYNPYRPIGAVFYNQMMLSIHSDMSQKMFNGYPENEMIATILHSLFGHPITDADVLESFRRTRGMYTMSARQKMLMLTQAKKLLSAPKKIPHLKRIVVEENQYAFADKIRQIPSAEKIDYLLQQLLTVWDLNQIHMHTLAGSMMKSMLLRKALKSNGNVDPIQLEADHNLLLSHCNDVVSAEIPNMLRDIARTVEDKEAFAMLTDEEALQVLQGKAGTEPKAVEMFADFLKKHGHRGNREIELWTRPLAKNPLPAVQVVKSLLSSKANLEPKPRKSTEELLSELQAPPGAFKKFLIKRWLLPMCQNAVGYRENTKSLQTKYQSNTRDAVWCIAEQMHASGMVPEVELFFFLKLDEVNAILKGVRNPIWLWKAKQRRRLWPTMDRYRFEEFIKGFRMAPRPTKKQQIQIADNSTPLTGTAVTVGNIKGRVCVAETFAEASAVQLGDILLTYSTDIGWSPYFPLISGIVTEIGGTISHGSVIAREYGIPCLVGVEDVCQHFTTGDIAYLDCKAATIVKVKE